MLSRLPIFLDSEGHNACASPVRSQGRCRVPISFFGTLDEAYVFVCSLLSCFSGPVRHLLFTLIWDIADAGQPVSPTYSGRCVGKAAIVVSAESNLMRRRFSVFRQSRTEWLTRPLVRCLATILTYRGQPPKQALGINCCFKCMCRTSPSNRVRRDSKYILDTPELVLNWKSDATGCVCVSSLVYIEARSGRIRELPSPSLLLAAFP